MTSGLIEILGFLAFVLPLCWWQLRDLKKAKEETARKRALAKQQALDAARESPAAGTQESTLEASAPEALAPDHR